MALKFIKIEIRNNLFYPSMFILCVNSLRIIRILFNSIISDTRLNTLFSSANIISSILFSSMFLHIIDKLDRNNINENVDTKIMGISLIQNQVEMNKRDGLIKILILICLDAYFYLVGITRRNYFLRLKQYRNEIPILDIRIRSREILYASFLYYLYLNVKLYKHQKYSLIGIVFCIINLYILEGIIQIKMNNNHFDYISYLTRLFYASIISSCRVLSDIIEKYLLEYNYLIPYKLLRNRGIFELIFLTIFFFFKETREEFSNLFSLEAKNIFLTFFLLSLFFIVSGFSNIYKILTIKLYTPVTRTLADSALDFLFFLYYSMIEKEIKYKQLNTRYFYISFILQIIIVFFNLVYNEFIVLYFCGLEKETHLEIMKRAKIRNSSFINNNYNDENASFQADIN